MSETHVTMKLKDSNTWSSRDIPTFWKATFYASDANPKQLTIIAIFQHIWNAMNFIYKIKTTVIMNQFNIWTSYLTDIWYFYRIKNFFVIICLTVNFMCLSSPSQDCVVTQKLQYKNGIMYN